MSDLDIAALDELQSMLGEDLYDITDEFVAQLDGQLRELFEAYRQRDLARLQTLAHTLKGSAANLGAIRVAALAAQIMTLAREGRPDAIRAPLAGLPAACQSTVAQMRAHGYARA